jgi:hypothetical protein
MLFEGGNAFPDVVDVKQEYVPGLLDQVRKFMPGYTVTPDIGSAGYKIKSGDMDLFLDQAQVLKQSGQATAKDPVKAAKAWLAADIAKRTGFQTVIVGRNVHVRMPLPDGKFGQVDLMVIPDAAGVAPWHQHGPRGSYDDPDFAGGHIFMLMNSIGKSLGLKFDGFSGTLMRRDNNEVIAGPDRDEVAGILIPGANGNDFNSVKSIMQALARDPQRDAKLAQARDDQKKGLIKLFEPLAEDRQPMTLDFIRTLLEADASPRIPHPEDSIFSGSANAANYLGALQEVIANPGEISIKWDGGIALIFGNNAAGEFVISDKYMAPKGVYPTSPEGWVKYDQDRGANRADLYAKIAMIWNGLRDDVGNTPGLFKGDLMHSGKLPVQNGMYVFSPTTVEYRVPVKSAMGQLIGNKVGIVAVHQHAGAPWDGKSGLSNAGNVAILSPTAGIKFKLNEPVQLVTQANRTISQNGRAADDFLAGLDGVAKTALQKYFNHKITGQTSEDLPAWLQHNVSGKQYKTLIGDGEAGYMFIHLQGFEALKSIWNSMYQLKNNLVQQLEPQVQGFQQWTGGQQSGEGFVFPSSIGLIKLVNRGVFGQAHFNK